MVPIRTPVLFVCIGLLVLLSQTNASRAEPPEERPQAALVIVASIQPLALMARDIAGESADVQVLLQAGQTPHNFAFKVSDRQRLARADLLLWVGPTLEPYLQGLAGQQRSLAMVAAVRAAGHDIDTADHAQGNDHGHAHGDQHLWLNPEHGAEMIRAIAEQLAALNPGLADQYRQRAQHWRDQLQQLRAKSGTPRPYAVVHKAYQHLLEAFQYPAPLVLTPTPDVSPGARQLWQTAQSLAAGDCVLMEAASPRKWILSFTERYQLSAVEVDIMGLKEGVSTYYQLLEQIVDVFDQCAFVPRAEASES